jgi:VIT1/CCC1 family predicted Fe2+/Mn2+ transporter
MSCCHEIRKNSEFAVLVSQLRNELTEAAVYERLANMEKNPKNQKILKGISEDEMSHARIISGIVAQSVRPSVFKVFWTVLCARIFGLTFVLRLMERGENAASGTYRNIVGTYPELAVIAEDEDRHESELIGMLHDERLNNMGAIVLGLNDALVELTGALAGFTFALGDSVKIAKLGLITGFAAAMSMAASAFLSARAEAQAERGDEISDGASGGALWAALYTGVAYVGTVFLLVAPYALFSNATFALAVMLMTALGIIAFFNFYLSVARGVSFKRGFFMMAGISTFVSLISYGFGYLLR